MQKSICQLEHLRKTFALRDSFSSDVPGSESKTY